MKLLSLLLLPLAGVSAFPSAVPETRILAGVEVPDGPIIRHAIEYARSSTPLFAFNHVMRSWVFGVLLVQHNSTLLETIDIEVLSIAAILHDLGWDGRPNSTIISADRRFEVDGAIAARGFIQEQISSGHGHESQWDKHRQQLVWDTIALHATPSISAFKEVEVDVTQRGILVDFTGPSGGITQEEYDTVVKEWPRDSWTASVNETIVWLCASKPSSTYDTWMQPFGEHFVPGYSAEGERIFDIMQAMED